MTTPAMDPRAEHLSPVWSRITPIVAERGEGAYLWDTAGRQFLDFTSGIGVTNTGHCHPHVVAAAQAQVAKLIHGQANIVWHEPMFDLAERLREVTPPGLDSFFFSNSGAEAIEASIKLARQATGRPNILAFERGFHGRTIGAMSLTASKTIYRTRYQPLMPGVFFAPFPYEYRWALKGFDQMQPVSDFVFEQIEYLLHAQTAPDETAAILVETVLGEGGYILPTPDFLPRLRELCDRHGMLLILDEVQSGFGRTGRFFALEHWNVTPDILVMAKGLASGFPLSGIVARRELMDRWLPGSHGGTYGGNAVACAAAVATVEVLREGLIDNAVAMGELLISGLHAIQDDFPIMGDVRGLGLMIGVEFTHQDGSPAPDIVKRVVAAALDENLLLLTCGTEGNVIRWIPPLIVSEAQIVDALTIFREAVKQTA